jgi:beta-hydroxylase
VAFSVNRIHPAPVINIVEDTHGDPPMRWIVLLLFVASAVVVHLRGRVRHGLFRQLSDHSTFTAPLNCFCYLFSAVPTTPFLPTSCFPELAQLKQEWRTFRQEALALYEMQRIRPSDKVDDIGFNSFFRRGWKRFSLKWYDNPHPSATARTSCSTRPICTTPPTARRTTASSCSATSSGR